MRYLLLLKHTFDTLIVTIKWSINQIHGEYKSAIFSSRYPLSFSFMVLRVRGLLKPPTPIIYWGQLFIWMVWVLGYWTIAIFLYACFLLSRPLNSIPGIILYRPTDGHYQHLLSPYIKLHHVLSLTLVPNTLEYVLSSGTCYKFRS